MFRGNLPAIMIGRTWVLDLRLTYQDDDGHSRPIPQDELEGVTFRASLKTEDGCRVLSAESGSGITVAAPGVVEWRIESGASADLLPGMHVATLDVTDGSDVDPILTVRVPVRC
jgi:hypothetical protein